MLTRDVKIVLGVEIESSETLAGILLKVIEKGGDWGIATVQAVMGNLSASDRRILTAVNTGASTFSFIGSGFIVLCYLLFKELRKFSFKLVFFLALSVSIIQLPDTNNYLNI